MPSKYSREEIEKGLTTLIITGNETRTSEITGIPQTTLSTWTRTKADRITELRQELEPQIVKTLAAGAEEVAILLTERERQLAQALTPDVIASLKPQDIASTLRNVSTSKALQLDKVSSPLRERPSHVQQHGAVEDVVARLSRTLGITFDATSTAEEIPTERSALSLQNAAPNAQG